MDRAGIVARAAERYLKGWLIGRGWKLERAHDLGKLLQSAGAYSGRFERFMDFGEDLTQQFWLQHYPGDELPDEPLNYDDLRCQAGELIAVILKSTPKSPSDA